MRNTFVVAVATASLIAACAQAAAAEEKTGAASAEPAFEISAAPAGLYKSDPKHAAIYFSYDHFGYSRPHVRWRSWTAELNWKPEAPEKSTVKVVIDATKPDSGVDMFDGHLQGEGFFNSAKYPGITFASTKLTRTGATTGKMTGDLTIKGVTKPVTLDVTLNRAADDQMAGAYKLGFSARGTVKRSDYGVDKYAPMVSDEVDLVIETEFVMPKEPAPAQ